MTGSRNRRGETGLCMEATEVDSPLRFLFKGGERAANICRSCLTGLSKPSNNYHTNRNTGTNASTHEDTPPSGDAGEETGGDGREAE